jgi:hypothetical protein
MQSLRDQAFAIERSAALGRLTENRIDLVLEVAADAEQSYSRVATEIMGRWHPACKSGCAWCCHIEVVTTVPEALLIADHIRSLPPRQSSLLRRQVDANRRASHDMNSEGRAKMHVPCGLLVNNKCAVYSVRPLACRGWSSSDVKLCHASYTGGPYAVRVPINAQQKELLLGVSTGLRQALREAGLCAEGGSVELNAAVDIALTSARAAEQWLAGEYSFAEAVPRVTDLEKKLGVGRAAKAVE